MRPLARELRELGYEPTGEESPFDEDGMLWSNSYEFVCDKTASVIRKDSTRSRENNQSNTVYRYENSNRAKLCGGFVSSYHWGENEDGFTYDKR